MVLAAWDLRLRTHTVAALASVPPGKAILEGRLRKPDRAAAEETESERAAGWDTSRRRVTGRDPGGQTGDRRKARRGNPGRVVRLQTTRAVVPGDPGPHASAAPPAASAAVAVSGLRPGRRTGGDSAGGLSSRLQPGRHA